MFFKLSIFTRLKLGTLCANIFFLLFGFYFLSITQVNALTVKHVYDEIPQGKAGCYSYHYPDDPDTQLTRDRTQDPHDILFSDDGKTLFIVNKNQYGTSGSLFDYDQNISMNKVGTPFELKTVLTGMGSTSSYAIPSTSKSCEDVDAFDHRHSSFVAQGADIFGGILYSIHISQGGKIFFIMTSRGEILRYDLSIPNDFRTAKYVQEIDIATDTKTLGFSISKDGSRMFGLDSGSDDDTPVLKTYSLSPAFDLESATEIHSVDLSDPLGNSEAGLQSCRDVEFSRDGGEMFISCMNGNDFSNNKIHQFSLGKNYDVSTATHLGHHQIVYPGITNGIPRGFSFSPDGMKIYMVQLAASADKVDHVVQYDLECPYGLVKCSSDTSSSIEAQFELAKQNISLNVDTIFKRFEWIRRNRDNENLSAHNFKINYEDPLLKTLANKFEPSVRNNVASFISKHKTENKKSKWSSWSLADISLSIFEKDGSAKAKDLNTRGLTLGADRKFGDNKFFGLALRYGDSSSNIKFSAQDVTMESLTLNLYGILPSINNQYLNAVLGLSHLKYDHRYVGNLSGERKGKQAFATINYRTEDKYGILNVTPTGKLTYGVTRLSEFTDFLSKASGLPARDVIYKEDTFTSGELAAGFLFETDIIETDQGTFQPMGGIEILYDLTSDVDYKYVYQGDTPVNKDTIQSPFSRQNLKTSLGFEAIHLNGFTVSSEFQRTVRLNDTKEAPGFTKDTFIMKFSRSKEDTQFAFNFDPLINNTGNLSYLKHYNYFDLKLDTNYSFVNENPGYGVNLQLSNTF